MTTIGESIDQWKKEYEAGDTVHKYLEKTILILEKFEVERKLEFLNTQPEITREQYIAALDESKRRTKTCHMNSN